MTVKLMPLMEEHFDMVDPMTSDAREFLEYYQDIGVSLEMVNDNVEAEAYTAFVDEEIVGIVGNIHNHDGVNVWWVLDRSFGKSKTKLYMMTRKAIEEMSERYGLDIYAHSAEGEYDRFMEFLGFKETSKVVEFRGKQYRKWKYDRS